ncbi:hypothetical protein [Paenibacillus sp. Marseille-Q4541]|uniref:hypothetical protein n=1 Tax=Paenibacillus sp. Marseille-Q4541 TaxID=2831522 RepID=UPI001BA709FE|nr:hypothetical protein [Paenibacillus sp. Marseille-Q4541]
MLQQWKDEVIEINQKCKDFKSGTARSYLIDARNKLQKKISDEENRLRSIPEIRNIDGVNIEIPRYLRYGYDKYTYEVHDNILYVLDRTKKFDNDGSYHWFNYVWIPQKENKYALLSVRLLGGDRFGDRYFLGVSYFKHPADEHSYLHKEIQPNNRTYKPYADIVVREVLGV